MVNIAKSAKQVADILNLMTIILAEWQGVQISGGR